MVMINERLGDVTQSWLTAWQKGVFAPCFPHQMDEWVLECSVSSVTMSTHCLGGGKVLPVTGRWTWPVDALGLTSRKNKY